MIFFYVNQDIDVNFDNHDLRIFISLKSASPAQLQVNNIPFDRIYFSTPLLFDIFINHLKKNNQVDRVMVYPQDSHFFQSFLAEKSVNNYKLDKLRENPKIGIITDLNNNLSGPGVKKSFTEQVNRLNNNLINNGKNPEINLFTLNVSEIINLYLPELKIKNIYNLIEPLDKLMAYDLLINFSDIILNKETPGPSIIDLFPETPTPVNNLNNDTGNPDDLVSVLMATYNRDKYLSIAIESVLSQTYKNIELIIVDDGSTDQTKTIINKYQQKYNFIRYFFQENQGLATARNTGISSAKGKYLTFLDDDDLYMPYTVERLLLAIKGQPENIKMVYGDQISFLDNINESSRNEETKSYFIPLLRNYKKGLKKVNERFPDSLLPLQYLVLCPIVPGQVIIEKDALIAIGMFNPAFRQADDYDAWTRLIAKYQIASINIPVLFYRRHEQQSTENKAVYRYFSDKVCLKFLYSLNLSDLYNSGERKTSNQQIAEDADILAKIMLKTYFAHYDSALELLYLTQKLFYKDERQRYIETLEKNIPVWLKEYYGSDLRISEQEKQLIKSDSVINKSGIK